jgi:hypothetical protein
LNFFLSKEMKEEQLEIAEHAARVEVRPSDVYHPISPPTVRA